MAAAITALNNVGVCGPTVFQIAPGTYTNSTYTLGAITGASAVNTVTFTPASGTVDFQIDASSTTNNFVFRFNGSSWVILKNLKLTNTDPSTYAGLVNMTGICNGITVDGCTLTALSTLNTTSTNHAAVLCGSSSSDIVKNFTFKNNSVINNGHGLYLYGDFNSAATNDNENLVIEDNTFTGIKY
jgi:polygalacturonase